MDTELLQGLQRFRHRIKSSWGALQRTRLVNTPLADPEILSRMFDSTLDEVFRRMRAPSGEHSFTPVPTYSAVQELCACGGNPLLAYYPSCEQALLGELMDLTGPEDARSAGAVREIQAVVRFIAAREVATFCSLCQRRQAAEGGGQPGTPEYVPMTRVVADSWLVHSLLDGQPACLQDQGGDGPPGGRE